MGPHGDGGYSIEVKLIQGSYKTEIRKDQIRTGSDLVKFDEEYVDDDMQRFKNSVEKILKDKYDGAVYRMIQMDSGDDPSKGWVDNALSNKSILFVVSAT